MDKSALTYQQYAERVAELLDIPSVEALETKYNDMISDCYELGDDIHNCAKYCRYDTEEFTKPSKEISINPLQERLLTASLDFANANASEFMKYLERTDKELHDMYANVSLPV